MWEVVGLNMWEVAGLWSLIKPKFYQVGHATELTFKLLETSNFILQSRIAMVLWGIWKRQNEKLRNQVNTTPNISISLIMQFLLKWIYAWKISQLPREFQTAYAHSQWTKPQRKYLNINVDATLSTDENKFCIGLCLPIEGGTFFKA